jgi:hypothetical protein
MSPLGSAIGIALATLVACTGTTTADTLRATAMTRVTPMGTAMMPDDAPKSP